MSSDRPPVDGPADSPWPDPATPAPAQPEPTVVIPLAEPTQALPTLDPAGSAPRAWASGPTDWPPPNPTEVVAPQPGAPAVPYGFGPPPPASAPIQAGWQYGQTGPYPAQGFVAQPDPYPAQGFAGQPDPYPAQGFAGQPDPYPAQGFAGQLGPYGAGAGFVPPGGPPAHWATAPPPPLAGDQRLTPSRKRGTGMLVALVVVVAVVLIGLIVALALPVLTHLPSIRNLPSAVPTRTAGSKPSATAKPTPSASSTASPDPKPTMPTSPLDVLKKNPIYGLKVPAKCAYQSTPGSQAAFRKQVRKLIDCENAAWRKALAPTAVKFGKPSVKFYSTSAMSPCGKLGTNYPASYCTADSTLYFSGASYLQGRYFRLSVAGFVMHEYAHHVQKLAGIFGATSAMKENASASSRRIELQAHCIAHYGLTVSGVGYSSVDDRQVRYQWDYTNDPKGHGSTTAERYWGLRGLDGKTIGACNTWSAKASRVK